MNPKKKSVLSCAFILTFLLGLILWAKEPDSYVRENLAYRKNGGAVSHCLIVRPRLKRPWPVMVYIHKSTDEMAQHGGILKKTACAGFTCVDARIRQFEAKTLKQDLDDLIGMLEARKLMNGQGCAWMAYGITPECFVQLAALPRERQPDLVICMPDMDEYDIHIKAFLAAPPKLDFPVFIFTNASQTDSSQQEALRTWLQKGGNHIDTLSVQGKVEAASTPPYWELAQRVRQKLNSAGKVQAFGPLSRPEIHSVCFFFWPATGFLFLYGIVLSRGQIAYLRDMLLRQKMAPYFVCVLGIALGCLLSSRIDKTSQPQFPTHALTPETIVSFIDRWNLTDARRKDVREYLELANYCRQVVNWNVDEPEYEDYVLNPVLKAGTKTGLEWRWMLWRAFYPKIRKANSPLEAASVLAEELRAEVEIQNQPRNNFDLTRIWRERIASPDEFKILHVAALRSLGICARTNAQGMVEIFQATKWLPAPLPSELRQNENERPL